MTQIIEFIFVRKGDQKEGDTALFFKILHKPHLMRMDIGKRKGVCMTFFGIKTDRNPLYGTDIVYRTLLVKIGKGNVSGCLVDIDRCDRCRYFLDQGKSVFGIFFIGPVDKFF